MIVLQAHACRAGPTVLINCYLISLY